MSAKAKHTHTHTHTHKRAHTGQTGSAMTKNCVSGSDPAHNTRAQHRLPLIISTTKSHLHNSQRLQMSHVRGTCQILVRHANAGDERSALHLSREEGAQGQRLLGLIVLLTLMTTQVSMLLPATLLSGSVNLVSTWWQGTYQLREAPPHGAEHHSLIGFDWFRRLKTGSTVRPRQR